MDKSVIKNFAIWARNKLIEDVAQRAYELGIVGDEIKKLEQVSQDYIRINGKKLKPFEINQRKSLETKIREKGFDQVVEEVAYTWFNRIIALRFMEVNGYLPTGVRVLSSTEPGKTEPDIITHAEYLDLELNQEVVARLKDENDTEELFRYLLVKQCNELNKILPGLFEEIGDYTDILLPKNLLSEGSVIRCLVSNIPEEYFKEQVEIIGWLYQYYISEKKDEVFAGLRKNKKITKENIPAATQLFTPKWIVKYMVENSLGRLWQEGHPDEELKSKWKYYLEEAEQEPEVEEQLKKIRQESKNIKPEDIKVLDPAMGSGHILVYGFDVLFDIYKSAGYSEREIPKLILENNLYGLDIDDRAGQLAYFAVTMKARSKNRRIFRENIDINLCSIQESNGIPEETITYFAGGEDFVSKLDLEEEIKDQDDLSDKEFEIQARYLIHVFHDAKEYGSILEVKKLDFEKIEKRLEEIRQSHHDDTFEFRHKQILLEKLPPLIKQAKIMSGKYDVVVTNPPYMGRRGMNNELKKYVDVYYKDSKNDLFAVFMETGINYLDQYGLLGMINQHSWMFLSSFEKLREKVIDNTTIHNMLHLGSRAFEEIGGEVVQSTAFVNRNCRIENYKGNFIRLIDFNTAEKKEMKTLEAIQNPDVDYRYTSSASDFFKIPGSPIAYWASDKAKDIFYNNKKMGDIAQPKVGLQTGNNNRYLRIWTEVPFKNIGLGYENSEQAAKSKLKWFPYNKGGEFRKWYGNNEFVVNWENDGAEIRNFSGAVIRNQQYYFKEAITWSFVSSSKFGVRYSPEGFIFDVAGSSVFPRKEDIFYLTAFMCSKLAFEFLKMQNPTLNFQVGNIKNLPIVKTNDAEIRALIDKLARENISISKTDWDSFETSWDFKTHPILIHKGDADTVEEAFNNWAEFAEKQFYQLKANEEELNRIFTKIYDLEDELKPEVDEKDVTVSKADKERDVKSFISYAVGCMLGRYSPDVEGLVYAGADAVGSGKWIVESIISGVEKGEGSKLPAVDSMAKGDGFGGDGISNVREVSKRGNVCIDKSDTESGGFDTIKHSGRSSSQIDSRIYKILINCARFKSGSGDANNACPAFELCEARRSRTDTKSSERNCKDDIRINEQPKITTHCPLSTIHFLPSMDNIIPITDEEYFEDDIVARFVEFVKVTFGDERLEENLDFIAESIGKKKTETSRQALRRYFLKDFYKNHVQTYKKRPIYWLFDSGRQDGFKALIYMHRYDGYTVARVRTDYLHKLQRKYEEEIKRLDVIIDSDLSQREKNNARRAKEKLQKQIQECLQYDQVIAHVANQKIKIDLDDGVKVNYAKFQGIKVPQGDGKRPLKANLLAKI